MAKNLRMFNIDTDIIKSEVAINENIDRDDLYFHRFIGGNSSETEELTRKLRALREKKTLLIGIFRFPFRFEGKKRMEIATTQYFLMKDICDAIIYFDSDRLMETIDTNTTIRDAQLTFNQIEEYTMKTMRELVDKTGDINIDFQDIKTFIKRRKGPLFVHTVEADSFDEPLKYLISTPYLPDDFTDSEQLIINIGYSQDTDMDAFRQINLRLSDLFSKADLFKLGSYFIDEPGERFKIMLLVNGIEDPVESPEKKPSKYRLLLDKWQQLALRGRGKSSL